MSPRCLQVAPTAGSKIISSKAEYFLLSEYQPSHKEGCSFKSQDIDEWYKGITFGCYPKNLGSIPSLSAIDSVNRMCYIKDIWVLPEYVALVEPRRNIQKNFDKAETSVLNVTIENVDRELLGGDKEPRSERLPTSEGNVFGVIIQKVSGHYNFIILEIRSFLYPALSHVLEAGNKLLKNLRNVNYSVRTATLRNIRPMDIFHSIRMWCSGNMTISKIEDESSILSFRANYV